MQLGVGLVTFQPALEPSMHDLAIPLPSPPITFCKSEIEKNGMKIILAQGKWVWPSWSPMQKLQVGSSRP